MTTAPKRNKYARDHLRLNISGEDVIVWIDFLLKSLHYFISPKKLLKFCMKSEGEEDCMEAVKSFHESIQVFIKYLIFFFCVLQFQESKLLV